MKPDRSARRGVVICGAYGMENAGDDEVLRSILSELRRIDRDMPVTVLARAPKKTAASFGVQAIHPMRFFRWYAALGRASLLLSGGGSLLQDVTSRRSLLYYLTVIRAAKSRGCAVQLYGCGIGPLTRERSRRDASRVLNTCADVITLRDPDSAELLRQIGVAKPPVLLAADPAIAPIPAPAEREKAIGFALRDWPGFSVPAFADAAQYTWEAYKLTPVFLCFAPEDRAVGRALRQTLAARGVPCDVSADARRTGRMALVLSMRLHGLILALRAGTPAAGISYDPKVAAFCADAGLPALSLEDAAGPELRRLIDQAAHLDGECLSAAAQRLRRREKQNGASAAQLLARNS